MFKSGKVIENDKWVVKIYAPPKEHKPAHVHVYTKTDRVEVKISLTKYEVLGPTKMDKRTVSKIIKWIDKNFDTLMEVWEKLHEKN